VVAKKIIAFAHHKGGTGKTTSCINVAGFLAKAGKKVLVLDFDPQGNATAGLGVDNDSLERSMSDVMLKHCGKSDVALDQVIIETDFEGIDLAPSNIDLSTVEADMYKTQGNYTLLEDSIYKLRKRYDYVLIDTPPSHGLLILNGLIAADEVILCLDSGVFALEGIKPLKDVFEEIKKGLGREITSNLVLLTKKQNPLLSLFFGDPSIAVEKTLIKSYNMRVMETPFSTKVFHSQTEGKPISHFAPASNVGKSYKKIAEEVMKNG